MAREREEASARASRAVRTAPPKGRMQAGEPDRVLGYKVYTSAYFPVPAPGKAAVAFGDFSYYNIGDRGSRSIAELKELFAGNGMVGFVAKERVDGKLVLPEAVKLLKMASA